MEIAKKPPEQVNGVNPLVEQLTAPRQLRIHPPLPLVPHPSPMPVPAADEEQIPDLPRAGKVMGATDRRVVPMVEAHSEDGGWRMADSG